MSAHRTLNVYRTQNGLLSREKSSRRALNVSCGACRRAWASDAPGVLASGLLASIAAVALQFGDPSAACAVDLYYDVQQEVPLVRWSPHAS